MVHARRYKVRTGWAPEDNFSETYSYFKYRRCRDLARPNFSDGLKLRTMVL